MSKLFEVRGYKDDSYFLTTNSDSLGEGGKSGVVGYDASKDAWRIVRYPLDLSNIKDTTPQATQVKIEQLVFKSPNTIGYFDKQSATSGLTSEDYSVYGLFSTLENLGPNSLQADSEAFEIVNFENFEHSLEIVVNELNISLNISETTNYYLYIFTKDVGDPKGRLFYWSAGSRGTEKVYNSIVIGSGEIITYTKLLPPSNFTTEIEIISPSGSVPLSWKATEEEYCDGYMLKWQCFNKEGSVFIEGRQTNIYTFNAFELQRGEQLILSLVCHHSADQNFNSDMTPLESLISINNLPDAPILRFDKETILPYAKSMTVYPIIEAGDLDGQHLTYKYRLEKEAEYSEYDSDKGITFQRDQTIVIVADDGIEQGRVSTYKIGSDEIENLVINIPPTWGQNEVQINYDFPTDQLQVIGIEGDVFLEVAIKTVNGITEWVKYETNMSIDKIINGKYESFNSVEVYIRLKDEYEDVSTSKQATITPILTSKNNGFLGKIIINELAQWTSKIVSGLEETSRYSITNGIITIENINALMPNENYTLKIQTNKNGHALWLLTYEAISGNFIKFTHIPKSLGVIEPFKAWLLEEVITWQCSVGTSEILNADCYLVIDDGTPVKLNDGGSSDNTAILFCNQKNMYDWTNNDKLYGQIIKKAYLQYSIDEDDLITSDQFNITLNFDYIAQVPELEFSNPVYEGYIPQIDLQNYLIASQTNLEFILQINRGSGYVDYDTRVWECPILERPKILQGQLILPKIEQQSIVFKSIGEIADTNERKWKVKIRLTNNQTVEKGTSEANELITQVLQHTAPTNFSLINSAWFEAGYAEIKFEINLNTNATNFETTYFTSSGTVEKNEENDKILKYTPPEDTPGPYQITVEVQTTVTRPNGTSTIKKALSNTFVVYPEGPTVAYRHHHLGINTTIFENDALMALAPGSNDRNKIYLRGANRIATIDLISGGLSNFVVDCGSWDNTPGGIIPTPDLPTGLATIAYTGEVGDLKQTRTDVIILQG